MRHPRALGRPGWWSVHSELELRTGPGLGGLPAAKLSSLKNEGSLAFLRQDSWSRGRMAETTTKTKKALTKVQIFGQLAKHFEESAAFHSSASAVRTRGRETCCRRLVAATRFGKSGVEICRILWVEVARTRTVRHGAPAKNSARTALEWRLLRAFRVHSRGRRYRKCAPQTWKSTPSECPNRRRHNSLQFSRARVSGVQRKRRRERRERCNNTRGNNLRRCVLEPTRSAVV